MTGNLREMSLKEHPFEYFNFHFLFYFNFYIFIVIAILIAVVVVVVVIVPYDEKHAILLVK